MKNIQIIVAGFVVIALLCSVGPVTALNNISTGPQEADKVSDTIETYNDLIGADSPLYGLKIAMEGLDETFTFNDTQRVEKQLAHGRLRIAEVRQELQLNRPDIAERALEQYKDKMNLTEGSLRPFTTNVTGLLHAQEMITMHQEVLANLLVQYPNNTGLVRAYNNSRLLELKFENKTDMRFTRFMEKDNKTVFKAVRLEIRSQNQNNNDISNDVKNNEQEKNLKHEKITEQNDERGINSSVTNRTSHGTNTTSVISRGKDSGPSNDQEIKGRD